MTQPALFHHLSQTPENGEAVALRTGDEPLAHDLLLSYLQKYGKEEVKCHPMYADFPSACFYIRVVRNWIGRGGQCLSLMPMLHTVQPVSEDGSEKRRTAMELQKQVPTLIEVRNLACAGFSSEEITGLFRVKVLYHQGAYHEATPEYRRLAFARRLYQQGRLQS